MKGIVGMMRSRGKKMGKYYYERPDMLGLEYAYIIIKGGRGWGKLDGMRIVANIGY